MSQLHPIIADAIAPFVPPPVRPDRYARTTFDAYRVSEPVKNQWNKTAPLQRTHLLGEVEAATVEEAVAATLEAFCFCHKQQLIIRETGPRGILMHIYQIVKKPDTWVYDANHIPRREQRLGVKFLCVVDGAAFTNKFSTEPGGIRNPPEAVSQGEAR